MGCYFCYFYGIFFLQIIVTITKFLGIILLFISFAVDPVPELPNKNKAAKIMPAFFSAGIFIQPAIFHSLYQHEKLLVIVFIFWYNLFLKKK